MKYDIARLRRTEFPWADTERTIYLDRKSTRLNSSHLVISYAVFCLKKKIQTFTVETPAPVRLVPSPSIMLSVRQPVVAIVLLRLAYQVRKTSYLNLSRCRA